MKGKVGNVTSIAACALPKFVLGVETIAKAVVLSHTVQYKEQPCWSFACHPLSYRLLISPHKLTAFLRLFLEETKHRIS